MDESPNPRRFHLPREIRIILSIGALVFVAEYLVLPQLASARRSLHLLSLVNPWLVGLAVLLEILAIYSYMELTRTVLHPHAPSRWNTLRVNLAGLAISHVVPGGTAPAGALSFRVFDELKVPRETNAFGLAAQGSGSAVVLNIRLNARASVNWQPFCPCGQSRVSRWSSRNRRLHTVQSTSGSEKLAR